MFKKKMVMIDVTGMTNEEAAAKIAEVTKESKKKFYTQLALGAVLVGLGVGAAVIFGKSDREHEEEGRKIVEALETERGTEELKELIKEADIAAIGKSGWLLLIDSNSNATKEVILDELGNGLYEDIG